MKEASEHFFVAFGMGIGSPVLDCVCGREHCAPDGDFLDEGEAERMRERAKNNPKRVILHEGVDAVSGRRINGGTWVNDCECNSLHWLESLLWKERERVLAYYRIRRDIDAQRLADLDKALQQ